MGERRLLSLTTTPKTMYNWRCDSPLANTLLQGLIWPILARSLPKRWQNLAMRLGTYAIMFEHLPRRCTNGVTNLIPSRQNRVRALVLLAHNNSKNNSLVGLGWGCLKGSLLSAIGPSGMNLLCHLVAALARSHTSGYAGLRQGYVTRRTV